MDTIILPTDKLRANALAVWGTITGDSGPLAMQMSTAVEKASHIVCQCGNGHETISLRQWDALWVVHYEGVNDAEMSIWADEDQAEEYLDRFHTEMDAAADDGCWFRDTECENHDDEDEDEYRVHDPEEDCDGLPLGLCEDGSVRAPYCEVEDGCGRPLCRCQDHWGHQCEEDEGD